MKLATSVDRFSTSVFADPYGVGSAIRGKLSVFDDSTSSSEGTSRRILETPVSFVMYSSNCIRYDGLTYIVGTPNYDYHRGVAVRVKYPAITCAGSYKIATILQILTSTVTATVAYSKLEQTSKPTEKSESATPVLIFTAFLQALESVSKGQVLITGSTYYKVRSDAYLDGAGFKNVEVGLLDAPLQTTTFIQSSGYDTTTDTIVNGTTYSDTKVFIEDAFYCYENTSERYLQLKPGDKTITFKPSVVPKSGDKVGGYKILSVDVLSDSSYACHCRR